MSSTQLPVLGRLVAMMFRKKPLIHDGIGRMLLTERQYSSRASDATDPVLGIKSRFLKSSDITSTAPDGVTFRPATDGDIEGILHLSRQAHKDQYKVDYLPGWLPRVLTDPNRIPCVAVKDEQIIAFTMAQGNVDGGKTVIGEAYRVLPDFAGTGVMGRCAMYSTTLCCRRWPHYDRFRSTSVHTAYFDRSDKVNIFEKRVYVQIHLKSEVDVPFYIQFSAPLVLSQLSEFELRELFADIEITKQLFRGGVISIGPNVFQPLSSNVRSMILFNENVFFDEANKQSLSIGGRIPCDDGRAWRYTFTYVGPNDMTACLCHLREHLKLYSEEVDHKDFYLVISLPKSFQNLFGKEAIYLSFAHFFGISREDIEMGALCLYDYV